ncbi:MAG: 30S ribosomal protein S5 [Phycisphaerae bacterium]|nr:30S ribosomal protein S5 [Phycisphaerae bacterium]MBM92768.1 30S ribosomal protein S5 [Phycisphaerae bacterium]
MAEILDESTNLESHTVGIYRTAATVKGGRRFSFGALVVVGDRRGKVGYGYAKSPEVPTAIEKAQKHARQSLIKIPMAGTTLPHEIEGTACASKVRLMPASPGTGVVAGGTVRAVMEIAGISDCLTKCTGSTSKLNTVKACLDGLSKLRTREQIAELRGVEITTSDIEERIERGSKFMPVVNENTVKMAAPVNTIGQDRGGRGGRGGGRGGRGGRGGGGGRGGDRGAPAPAAAPAAAAEAPAPTEGSADKPSSES